MSLPPRASPSQIVENHQTPNSAPGDFLPIFNTETRGNLALPEIKYCTVVKTREIFFLRKNRETRKPEGLRDPKNKDGPKRS